MAKGKAYPPEARARARTYRDKGYSVPQIGEILGINLTTVRSWIDPEYAERRRASIREQSARRRCDEQPTRIINRREPGGLSPQEEAKLPPVPEDTRSTTGRLLGDPLPGRSALDRRRVE